MLRSGDLVRLHWAQSGGTDRTNPIRYLEVNVTSPRSEGYPEPEVRAKANQCISRFN
ncbi:unnamed protein product [Fusarium graminearum]|uniref:Chromosome 2, complete genome n=1 Tax=Gibberella zeae (strain ATCC MYA-4620 / CBS 123657 / FGSC 9075 / NRRL 31084 / PH-1) TaxID=229533 RepID=A0A098DJ89_GIBZE|nr:unnamed protein product [Fusarium graminearum]